VETSKLVDKLISRPDGLSHLLLSDVNALLLSIEKDFPDLARVGSIGKSTEGRDIYYIEINTDLGSSPKNSNFV
jgi:hypothetical protein